MNIFKSVMTMANRDEFQTIHTYQLRQWINEARAQYNEEPVRNNDFIARVASEFEGENLAYESFVVKIEGHGGARGEIQGYNLTVEQATYVAMRESKGVRRIVYQYIKELEETVRTQKEELEKARMGARINDKPMKSMLQKMSPYKLKDYHYANESNMLNRIVFGYTSKELCAQLNSPNVRDYVSAEKLEQLEYLTKSNITLLEIGMDYSQRKETLTSIKIKHFGE